LTPPIPVLDRPHREHEVVVQRIPIVEAYTLSGRGGPAFDYTDICIAV
jgi:hypothetical protein